MAQNIKSYTQQLVSRKGDNAVFGLQLVLDDEKALHRKYAVQALGRLSWEKTDKLIQGALQDPAASVRKEAVTVLATNGGEESVDVLRRIAYDDSEAKSVKDTAQAALKKREAGHQFQSEETDKPLSVYQFNRSINDLLSFETVQVEGEVSGVQTSSFGSHQWVFFDLKDEEKEAKVRCIGTVYILRQSQISLVDGMRVIVHGQPRLSIKSGMFGISVKRIRLSGEGELLKAFELLKKKLSNEGLFQPERKRALPRFPQKIGLITSQDAAAYRDFGKVLQHRMGGLDIYFRHVQVQGQSAVNEIIEAIQILETYPLDVIVITRGGGSIDDLHAFNSEDVARAIYASSIPIVCGVGHERDETIAGFVADVRASTPSNAAELIVSDARELRSQIDRSMVFMEHTLTGTLRNYTQRVDTSLSVMEGYFRRTRERVDVYTQRLTAFIDIYAQKTSELRHRTADMHTRIETAMHRLVATYRERVEATTRVLQSFDYRQNLERGYSITRKNGKIIRKAADLSPGDVVQTEMADGYIQTQVKQTYETKQSSQ